MITALVPIVLERDIIPKIAGLAQLSDALMGAVGQRKRWCDDVLTDDHLAAGLLRKADGSSLSAEELAAIRAIFGGFEALRVAANTPQGEGLPSVGAMVRPYL